MAPLDDNSMLTGGTSFCVGSRIFAADGSGGFNSHPIDRSPSEALEATRRQEIDDFIDQLEEVGLLASNSGTRNQLEFDTIRPKTLSELEEDLDKLLEDTKQEIAIDENILSFGCQQDITQEEQHVNSVSAATIESYQKDLMEIRSPRVDNSGLLNGIKWVSNNIQGCINLAKSALRRKKNQGLASRKLLTK